MLRQGQRITKGAILIFDGSSKVLKVKFTGTGALPLFFASFGTGHINPENRNGIAMKLLQDEKSPVRNSVQIIGVQYFNCKFDKDTVAKLSEASLNFCVKSLQSGIL